MKDIGLLLPCTLILGKMVRSFFLQLLLYVLLLTIPFLSHMKIQISISL